MFNSQSVHSQSDSWRIPWEFRQTRNPPGILVNSNICNGWICHFCDTSLEAASWWTEDGYDTAEEDDPAEEEDPGALGEDGEGGESESSEEDAEISAPQRRRFSGLGRAPRRGLALP